MTIKTQGMGTGTWIASGSPVMTELIDGLGFDWLLFDLEHGNMSENEVLHNLQVVRHARVIVRIGEFSPALIARVLDWGAAGIMMPHVSSVFEAERVVQAMRYPPQGNRGFSGSARCYGYGSCAPKDIQALVAPIFMAQIENTLGIAQAQAIARVPGVDVLFVGPADLRLDFTVNGKSDEDFDAALEHVASVAKKSGKEAGILVRNPADLPKLKRMGYTAIAAGSDTGVLRAAYLELIQRFR